jgi:uncharacterized protein (TIGR03435 family)
MPLATILGQHTVQSPGYKVTTLTLNTEKRGPFGLSSIPPGPLKYGGVTLKKLIMDAFIKDACGAPCFHLAGGPRWVSTDRWDLEAHEDGPIIWSTDHRRQMLLRLLEDRFHLRFHRETKVIPIYELAVASTGSKLRPDPFLQDIGPVLNNAIGSMVLINSSLELFAKLLSLHLGRPVVDKTGMLGLFRFSLDWAPVPGEDGRLVAAGFGRLPAPSTNAPSIFRAVQEQLGLRLTPKRGPVEVIVIDNAERPRAQ